MSKNEIIEFPNFKCTPKDFTELTDTLKSGKPVRNPFARFYDCETSLPILKDTEINQLQISPRPRKPAIK